MDEYELECTDPDTGIKLWRHKETHQWFMDFTGFEKEAHAIFREKFQPYIEAQIKKDHAKEEQ